MIVLYAAILFAIVWGVVGISVLALALSERFASSAGRSTAAAILSALLSLPVYGRVFGWW